MVAVDIGGSWVEWAMGVTVQGCAVVVLSGRSKASRLKPLPEEHADPCRRGFSLDALKQQSRLEGGFVLTRGA
jgi:hypothetical protein